MMPSMYMATKIVHIALPYKELSVILPKRLSFIPSQ